MRDIEQMKQIEAHMRGTVEAIHRVPNYGSGWQYFLIGKKLNGQVVSDMLADGWLIRKGNMLYLPEHA